MALNLAAKICAPTVSNAMETVLRPENECKREFRCDVVKPSLSGRRQTIACTSASLLVILTFNSGITPLQVRAEPGDQKEEDEGVVGAIKSLFDPNEKTKSGKVLPKAYLKSAREVVKTLRESLKEDPKDIAKFRRTADSAKESIRDYLSNWKGQEKVAGEESYVELEKAIRSLASFYSRAGPSAPLPEEIKNEILNDLSTAEEFL
ncbi:photosystem II D1 precursor processing protein PSB27-H2, chloroplastic [Durio zibethinus]|uniref:Photosystem II D1 precursor processing protein PSB27-H2, chloroplastic n=1 Tax=Durio zibethinus TaxID=66656 RepID=A0A6P5X341_DURZI|nr:photosystem II D1 precursor processing protein PSB27-H2, chloroplastic [Durio zibethinus]XP_022722603.1 photosystem II D1 precursor processing protein PSB27-H2, chloroplastic [Durio zibethinus]